MSKRPSSKKGKTYAPATRNVTMRLPETLIADLDERAAEESVSRTKLVKGYCEDGLKNKTESGTV